MHIDVIVAILTSSTVATIVSQIIGAIKHFMHYRKINRILLLYVIKELATEAIWNGYITTEDLQCLEDAYGEYKPEGGNGYADTLIGRARELPILSEEDAARLQTPGRPARKEGA